MKIINNQVKCELINIFIIITSYWLHKNSSINFLKTWQHIKMKKKSHEKL